MDFFKLNERLQLHRERAGMISLLGSALKFVEAGIDQVDNKRVIARLEGSRIPHAACLRAFRHLWRSDARSAKKIHSVCQQYAVASVVSTPPLV